MKHMAKVGCCLIAPVCCVTVAVAVGLAHVSSAEELPESARLELDDYWYSAKLTPSGYTGTTTLTNFPLLVDFGRLRRTVLPELMPAQYRADGSDVRFADAEGNVLDFDVDHADTGCGDLVCWVRIPELTSSTVVTMAWGLKSGRTAPEVSSTAVWDDYALVLHADEASGEISDATGNGHAARPTDDIAAISVATNASKFGLARAQSGGKYVVSHDESLAIGGTFTASGWFYSSSTMTFVSNKSASNAGNGFYVSSDVPDSRYWRYWIYGSGNKGDSKWVSRGENRWLYLTVVYNGNTCRIFEKATAVDYSSANVLEVVPSDLDLTFSSGIHGQFDEVRIRKSASSPDWVTCDYQQATADGFLKAELTGEPALQIDSPGRQPYLGGAAVEPDLTVRDPVRGTVLVRDEDYSVSYSCNTALGTATATVTGLGGTRYEGIVVRTSFDIAPTLFVAPDVAEEGTGESWESPVSVTNAFARVADGGVLVLKAGRYFVTNATLAATKALTLRGGYAGETGISVALDANGRRSVFDGDEKVATVVSLSSTVAQGVIEVDRCEFVRAFKDGNTAQCFVKGGTGPATLTRCRFADSRNINRGGGRGATLSGSAASRLVMRDCVAEGNAAAATSGYCYGPFGFSISTFDTAVLENCQVVSNGMGWAAGAGRENGGASGLAIGGAKALVRNCLIAGNRGPLGGSGESTFGAFVLSGACDGSVIENCRFVANRDYYNNWGYYISGALTISASATNTPVLVKNCSFAYNSAYGAYGNKSAAALTVQKGAVSVENTIFFKNSVAASGVGRDLHVRTAGSSAVVRYCLFEEQSAVCRTAYDGAILDLGEDETNVFDDPLFVSGYDEVTTTMSQATEAARGELIHADLHLRSTAGSCRNATGASLFTGDAVDSPAIDTGNPASSYSREQEPDGDRVNIGAYGNTPEASKSPFEIPEGAISVAIAGGVTRFVYTGEPIEPPVYVSDARTGLGLDASQYAVAYSQNVGPGVAYVTVTGRDQHSGSVTISFTITSGWHVTAAELDEEGTGVSWDSPVSLTNALAKIAAGEVLLLKAGVYLRNRTTLIDKVIDVRGGLKGTPGSRDDELDETNPESVFDVTNSVKTCVQLSAMYSSDVAAFSRCAFVGAYGASSDTGNGVLKDGTCSAKFVKCRFANNHTTYRSPGRGGTFAGSAALATLAFEDCVFSGNGSTGSSDYDVSGLGAHISNFKSVTFENCQFVTNSLVGGVGRDASGSGSALCVSGVPVTARGCTFKGNRAYGSERGYSGSSGGCVFLSGACGGSVFENCVFAGNYESARYYTVNPGALVLSLTDDECEVTVKNCTFAYNSAGSTQAGAAGLTVKKGTANVSNCIFHGNAVGGSNGADIHVLGTAAAFVTYSMFDSLADAKIFRAEDATLDIADTCMTADPRFVTETAPSPLTDATRAAIDVHLLSPTGYCVNATGPAAWYKATVLSPAIDAGNPDDDYADEPGPNGECVNLGAYGNTPEASWSPLIEPTVEGLEVTFADGYSQPRVTFRMGSREPGQAYTATVTVFCGLPGAEHSHVFTGVENGAALGWDVLDAYGAGETINVRVVVKVGNSTKADTGAQEVSVTGELPPWAGKDAPANVVLVREGALGEAFGEADGSSWMKAFATLQGALAYVKSSANAGRRDEIWMAGTNIVEATPEAYSVAFPVTIRGGFAGCETSLAQRPAGTLSLLTTTNRATTVLKLANVQPMTIERMAFTRGNQCGLWKSASAGDLTLLGCRFAQNASGAGNTTTGGGGAALFGDANRTANLVVSNCVFEGNVKNSNSSSYNGHGARFENFAHVTLDDSLFVTNGTVTAVWLKSSTYGNSSSALHLKNAPATVRRTRFAHNRNFGSFGDCVTVDVEGEAGGTAFTNCTWVGNEGLYTHNTAATTIDAGGALYVNCSTANATVDVVNCTIAYNLAETRNAAAGLTVVKGVVNARNTIIWGNVVGSAATGGADILVRAGARVNLDYSLLATNTADYASAADEGGIAYGRGMVYGDPCFVTTTNDVLAQMTINSARVKPSVLAIPRSTSCMGYKSTPEASAAVADFNVHLRGFPGYVDATTGRSVSYRNVKSPALDAGDPKTSCSDEAKPNGHRVNIGAYGNTPWATRSKQGGALIVR